MNKFINENQYYQMAHGNSINNFTGITENNQIPQDFIRYQTTIAHLMNKFDNGDFKGVATDLFANALERYIQEPYLTTRDKKEIIEYVQSMRSTPTKPPKKSKTTKELAKDI